MKKLFASTPISLLPALLISHVLVPPAMRAILGAADNRVQGFLAAGPYASMLRNSVMMIAFVKSMKKAPTIGATRKARGAGP